jgi:hypothetical protein
VTCGEVIRGEVKCSEQPKRPERAATEKDPRETRTNHTSVSSRGDRIDVAPIRAQLANGLNAVRTDVRNPHPAGDSKVSDPHTAAESDDN